MPGSTFFVKPVYCNSEAVFAASLIVLAFPALRYSGKLHLNAAPPFPDERVVVVAE